MNSYIATALAFAAAFASAWADVTFVSDGKPNCSIVVAKTLMDPPVKVDGATPREPRRKEEQRQRLQESVKDLALYLEKMSGAKVPIIVTPPDPPAGGIIILVGETGLKRFGPPAKNDLYQQGWRLVVAPGVVGAFGHSDLASSYAVYELLHRVGCRWFMPGELGEVIPDLKTISLPEMDVSGCPFTLYRGIWYADEAYKRRNRCGGLLINAGHALEGYISDEQRKQHPEWCALIKGKRDPACRRLEWHRPDVANAIGDTIIGELGTNMAESVSLSPDDGAEFSESPEDRALDSGDIETSMGEAALTDRFLVLCNRIAERVGQKHPNVLFGMLAYVQYTRPPLREKVHPNIVPQIAPITYSRAHPMTDDNCPGNRNLRYVVEGWGKKAKMTSYYAYAYNLAEVSVPTPMITKWSKDLPIIFASNCKFWQPETLPNFETTMHALYLGLRMSWDPTQKPEDIIAEIDAKFYGAAAGPMSRYWRIIDEAWVNTPEYSGCGFGYMRRFTPKVMEDARRAMNEALAACKTVTEYRRVRMADESLRLFELFMQIRRDFADGRLEWLERDSTRWLGAVMHLADQYKDEQTFCGAYWTLGDTVCGRYFRCFFYPAYKDAWRISQEGLVIPPMLRQWRYMPDQDLKGEALGWAKADFADKDWKTTDPIVETWSSLGLHNYMGVVWYRTAVAVPAVPAGKKVWLWIGSTDGTAKVFVNGQHVPYVGADGKAVEQFDGYCQPASFNVTAALKPGAANQITIRCKRGYMNELGTGGLLTHGFLYREK